MKKIFGLGTGPGDPELLTLKAVRILKEADVIFAPNNKGKNMSLDTVSEFVDGKTIVMLDYPMKSTTLKTYKSNAKIIEDSLNDGAVGVFITIGDPLFYSTVINTFVHFSDNVEVEYISGIPSFVAAAAAAKTPLALVGEKFMVVDAVPMEIADDINSIAILKTHDLTEEKLDRLINLGFTLSYVEKASFIDEVVARDKEEILKRHAYISLLLARRS